MKLSLIFLALNLAAPLANAKDFNLGAKNGATETARLSFVEDATKIKLRVAITANNLHCSSLRRDFCGIQDQIAMLEVTLRAQDCVLKETTLFRCSPTPFAGGSMKVIFKDGSEKDIRGGDGVIAVNQLRSINYASVEQIVNVLYLNIWGSRADGLDPLITSDSTSLFFEPVSLQEVSVSLF